MATTNNSSDVFYANINGTSLNLPPCSTNDGMYFEFLPQEQIGITKGPDTLISMAFSDIAIPVTNYNMQTKVLEPQEVIFIPGLSKGLTYEVQKFNDTSTYTSLDLYYLKLDLSINYYSNFRYISKAITASGNYSQNITIENALNTTLSNNNIKITATFDVSSFTFTGTALGYEYNISTAILTLYDSSNAVVAVHNLTEDVSAYIPSSRYPAGAMKGVLIKALYPTSNSDVTQDWLYINHVVTPFTYYEATTCASTIVYEKKTKIVDVGSATCTTSDTINAGDYLSYITENNLWNKFSKLYLVTEAQDNDDYSTENYIEGFYVFNPHPFDVQIDYMQFV